MNTDYEKSLDAVRKDVKDLHADLKAVLGAIKEGAKDKAGSVRERVEEAAERSEERVTEAVERLRKYGCNVCEQLAATAHEKPLLTILAAVGAGVILRGLLKWRHHS
jgi:ElaB/YqjD/DUF883 family membrane-anchored ribosome-binding protein